jgi:perosamine synthetase
MIRLAVPSIEQDDLDAVSDVLRTGFLVQGQKVQAFEQIVANAAGTKYAIALTNCTAALQMALMALDVRAGDLVLVTAYSWISTANAIELCGATPVFVDVDPHTYNMSPDALEKTLQRLTETKETRGRLHSILPVHAFGQPVDMTAINAIAATYNLPVIEDAACALGATWEGRIAGGLATMACFSFHPRKAVTTGEGGAITTNDLAVADRLRAMRNHGLDPNSATPDFIMPGFNCRMTEFQAAFGITQMGKFQRILKARRTLAKHYDQLLEGSGIAIPFVAPQAESAYQTYVARLPQSVAGKRAQIIAALKEQGIETSLGTWHMPLTRYFRTRYGYKPGDFPGADAVFASAISLPLYEGLSANEQTLVVNALKAASRIT